MCFRICVPSVSLTCEKLHLRTYIPACRHLLLVRFRTYSGKESKAQYTYEYSETCSDVRTVFRMWVSLQRSLRRPEAVGFNAATAPTNPRKRKVESEDGTPKRKLFGDEGSEDAIES